MDPDKNQIKIGGLAGVIGDIVIEKCLCGTSMENFANSGYVLIPYDYVLNKNYILKYIIDFNLVGTVIFHKEGDGKKHYRN